MTNRAGKVRQNHGQDPIQPPPPLVTLRVNQPRSRLAGTGAPPHCAPVAAAAAARPGPVRLSSAAESAPRDG